MVQKSQTTTDTYKPYLVMVGFLPYQLVITGFLPVAEDEPHTLEPPNSCLFDWPFCWNTHTHICVYVYMIITISTYYSFQVKPYFCSTMFFKKASFFDWYMFTVDVYFSFLGLQKRTFHGAFCWCLQSCDPWNDAWLALFFSIRLIPKAKCFSAIMVPFLPTLPKTNI